MRPRMQIRTIPTLPRLAWLADYDRRRNSVNVITGVAVECAQKEWIVEGVWDRPFSDGGFDRSAAFFGSGLKIVDQGLLLVPSSGILDRIVYCEDQGRLLASNSLALLLARTGASLDREHNYRREAFAATKGIDHYDPSFRIIHPGISEFRQLYYTPILVTPESLERTRRDEPPNFPDYTQYVGHLRETLNACHENSRSEQRRLPMGLFSTISAGYDSTAVTALARDLPITAAYTSRRSNSTFIPMFSRQAAIDDGSPIARALGIPLRYLERSAAPALELELLFLAPSANDPELIFHSMAADLERSSGVSMVLMGYHGDKVWDRNVPAALTNDQLKRGDMSGLNLSEVRLQAGFVVVAAPFIGARRITDLVAISNSSEMNRWQLGTEYDRPIPRRIAEEAGVLRSQFGHRKRAVVQYYDFPVNPELRRQFTAYLRDAKKISPLSARSISRVNQLAFPVLRAIQQIAKAIRVRPDSIPLRPFGRIDFPLELHLWALTELARTYCERLSDGVEQGRSATANRLVGPVSL